jgi:cell wall hydrolase
VSQYLPTLQDIDILARTIYGEARGEFHHEDGGINSFIAVANVVMNRLKYPSRYGQSVHKVCQKRFQFSCWNKNDPNCCLITNISRQDDSLFELAFLTAEKVSRGDWPDVTFGSNHYFSTFLNPIPSWAVGRVMQIRIGRHLFYKI